jgi:membrane-bound lytic murein transglycosylase F
MKALLALIATLLLGTCSQPPSLIDQVLAAGELRVATRNSPDAYYLGSHGPAGPAYELASRFAEDLGVSLRLYLVRTREAAIAEVRAGRAHVAAAGLTTGIALPPGMRFGPGYCLVREHLVQRRGSARPRSVLAAARGQIEVASGSAHQRTLEDLRLTEPDLAWIERGDTDTEVILDDVSRGTVQYTLASSMEFARSRPIYPDLAIALDMAPERAIAWVVTTAGHDDSLLGRVNAFFTMSRFDGFLAVMLDRYYGPGEDFDYLLSRNFMEHVDSRLPLYLLWFKNAAMQYGFDWRLLAAMGYQESKWDPSAVSMSGARGLMQMTEGAASVTRFTDRHDPRASIFGGAKYLARVLEMVPARIPEPDRTWFAVAAYNVGYGHVEDARILAQSLGRNPDRWEDVRTVLPLLSQEKWYTRTRHGYARGWEPVRYVDNVQTYLRTLEVAGADSKPPPETPGPAPRKSRPAKQSGRKPSP